MATTTRQQRRLNRLSFDMERYLRAAVRGHLQVQADPCATDFVPFNYADMPLATRDALERRGLIESHTIEGMAGGFTYWIPTTAGIARIED